MRKVIFWIHLTAGLLAGLVVLVMSVTGVLLAFERQIVDRAEAHLRASSGAALPPSRIVGKEKATAITFRSDPTAPALVSAGRGRTLLVDPATGNVLGEGAKGLKKFFGNVEDVHRWLAADRDTGKAITGASNLLFFFIVLSGPVLWWPRKGPFVFGFRGGLRGRARDFNWHNVLGIWSAIPLLLIVFSAMTISYPWVTRLVYAVAGGTPPKPQQQQPQQPKGPRGDVDAVWAAARPEIARTMPNWKSATIRLPIPAKGEASIAVDAGNGTRPDKRATLLLDAETHRINKWETYAAQEGGRKARAWLRWIHTGEAGGIAGQFVAAVASGAAVVLVWTGIALSLRRFRGWRRRKEISS